MAMTQQQKTAPSDSLGSARLELVRREELFAPRAARRLLDIVIACINGGRHLLDGGLTAIARSTSSASTLYESKYSSAIARAARECRA